MGWDRSDRYYSRSRKVCGRVVREYCGSGVIGEACALIDADRRALREEERAAWRCQKAEAEALEADLAKLQELTDLLARAALAAAGYHQHKRGEWRKRRTGQ
jgi:hypothetical protein